MDLQTGIAETELKVACFRVGGQTYAVDIMRIKQIIRPLKITRLPRAPEFLEGVIQLRGMVIPVVDMRRRFALEAAPAGVERRVIIAAVERSLVGLIVDDVTEVIALPRAEIQPPPRVVKGVHADYLGGVCRYRDDILLLLNLDEIFTSEEKGSLQDIKKK